MFIWRMQGDIMNEIWKNSISMCGYEISNYGNVRNIKRKVNLTPLDNGNGYLYVTWKRGGKRKHYYIHRLVAEAYCDKGENKREVNHIDFNRSNNRCDNLEWCTHIDNIHYSINMGRCLMTKERLAKLDASRKLSSALQMKSVAIFNEDGDVLGIYESLTSAAQSFGTTITSISRAIKRTYFTYMGNKLIVKRLPQ
jgi:hypothetical protein